MKKVLLTVTGFLAVAMLFTGVGYAMSTWLNFTDDARYEVLLDDYEALQEAYDTLHEGYNDLQQDYSRKTEQIEYLEYRIMSDDSISPELKQEIKENVPEEVGE